MLSKYGNCTRLLKIENKLKIACFYKVGRNSRYFVGVFNKTIIPLALVGYEMIIANSALSASLAIYEGPYDPSTATSMKTFLKNRLRILSNHLAIIQSRPVS